MSTRTGLFCFLLLLAVIVTSGCTRARYRLHADHDAYSILHEKAACRPWTPPANYSVYPDARSRMYLPTAVDDPALPIPSPSLYAYELPELSKRDPSRFNPATEHESGQAETIDGAPYGLESSASTLRRLPVGNETHGMLGTIRQASHDLTNNDLHEVAAAPPMIRLAVNDDSNVATLPQADSQSARENQDVVSDDDRSATPVSLRQVPIPASYWQSIPRNCLRRMLEFDSIRAEYRRTFQRDPLPEELDDAPQLALEDIIHLTQLNSRELQTQKETLYRVALGLSLQRFDYQLKPSVGGNGIATNFSHDRSGGDTVNSLAIPSSVQVDKMLNTGGELLARFANDVVLTFNGPAGFAADVGSDLLFDISQSVLQRDVRLESLTQAERDVVYAARDFARFRKSLFVQLASQYYSLIRQYRQVEINSQNYFTLVREFNQRQAEFRAGLASRIQLDQIEQQVIGGRSNLLNTCTSLDNSLDDLNVRIGLPTEQHINLDLSELNLLTLRDELAVNGELIQRVRARLMVERQAESPTRATLLSSAIVLLDRMLESVRLREPIGLQPPQSEPMIRLRARLQVDATRLRVEEARAELQRELTTESPSQVIIVQRRTDLIGELLSLIQVQIELAKHLEIQPEQLDQRQRQFRELQGRADQLSSGLERLIAEGNLEELPTLVDQSDSLQKDTEALVQSIEAGLGDERRTPEQELEQILGQVDQLLVESESYLSTTDGGLVPVEIDMDDAMLTALVQRFDLMNERGSLADDWRQIKLAADDLKSILNLRATQTIRTRSGVNRPFDFTFDESTTSVGATLDAPFNRRAQRNGYRQSLINYQAALRRLTELEDNIKLAVRRDLRSLSLDREQYSNDIASAALAFERVVSTEFELRLGIGSVIARDFLEAQNDYIGALSNVASRHIDYLVGRLDLFLDLEALTVDDDGFWQQLYDERHQPTPNYQLSPTDPAYGRLHPYLKYSPRIRRMQCVPNGTSVIHTDENADTVEALPTPDQNSSSGGREPTVSATGSGDG